jgi:electron transfer flavoprotein alpha subunit
MKILVILEQRQNKIRKSGIEVLCGAAALAESQGAELHAAVCGSAITEGDLKELGAYGAKHVHRVLSAEGLFLNPSFAGNYAALINSLKPELVMLPGSETVRDFLPLLAHKTCACAITDCTSVCIESGKIMVERPLMAAKAVSKVETSHATVLLGIRPGAYEAVVKQEGAQAELHNIEPVTVSLVQVLKEQLKSDSGLKSLDDADVVVAAGRGVKNDEGYALINQLAEVLDGAVGCTRTVVELGLSGADIQIGQTGKIVNPGLYIACGISGAIQHTAGMLGSRVIVAINKDAEAPIFNIADYGLVGDLFEILPLLIQEVKEIKKQNL